MRFKKTQMYRYPELLSIWLYIQLMDSESSLRGQEEGLGSGSVYLMSLEGQFGWQQTIHAYKAHLKYQSHYKTLKQRQT